MYPFSYRDELTGKWTKARYRAEHHVIARRFRETEWRIEGSLVAWRSFFAMASGRSVTDDAR
jgi:hypothetical protein